MGIQPHIRIWISAFEARWTHGTFMDENHFVDHLRFHIVLLYDPHAKPRTSKCFIELTQLTQQTYYHTSAPVEIVSDSSSFSSSTEPNFCWKNSKIVPFTQPALETMLPIIPSILSWGKHRETGSTNSKLGG